MSDDLQKANDAFSAGNYGEAVDLYKAAMDSVSDGDKHLIHSNIGASLQARIRPHSPNTIYQCLPLAC